MTFNDDSSVYLFCVVYRFASNKKWKHFIQRDIMAANTLARFMNTNLLMRQIIEGCKAKQYTHARKLFAYLLLHDNRKGTFV